LRNLLPVKTLPVSVEVAGRQWEMFVNAMRQGKHMGTSRPIQPPMPWQWYRNFNDDDLKAIFAYLKTVPPIVNHVPDYQPPAGSGD